VSPRDEEITTKMSGEILYNFDYKVAPNKLGAPFCYLRMI